MNLFALLNRGASYAPPRPRHPAAVVKAVEKTRRQWLNSLLVDQSRAWLELGSDAREVLTGLVVSLTLGGFVVVYETRDVDAPDLRVIRGAISAAEQCANGGCIMTPEHAMALCVAAQRASAAIRSASVDAIIHAAESIRLQVGLTSPAP